MQTSSGRRSSRANNESHISKLSLIRHCALLGGTALVSAAFISAIGATPVRAQVISIIGAGTPQNQVNNANCVSATDCIIITTVGGSANTITLDNNGTLNAGDDGIDTATEGASITITNDAAITAVDEGIYASVGAVINSGGTGGAGGLGGNGGSGNPGGAGTAGAGGVNGTNGAAGTPGGAGGAGGDGGDGGDSISTDAPAVLIDNNANITTTGSGGAAIVVVGSAANNEAGDGGAAGSNGSPGAGGDGGAGGSGGPNAEAGGNGGAGGAGGNAGAGGFGGTGGDASGGTLSINVDNSATLTTSGNNGDGIQIQANGGYGSGGDGGLGGSAFGGFGGIGGIGGDGGDDIDGGLSGGAGGTGGAGAVGGLSADTAFGADGGDGSGGVVTSVTATNSGTIATSGIDSNGISAILSGGAAFGGNGATGGSGFGGFGGTGGAGGTGGDGTLGAGGGGGRGGVGGAGTNAFADLGGSGGKGTGGDVGTSILTNDGTIQTTGDGSDGIQLIANGGAAFGGTGGVGGSGFGGFGGAGGAGAAGGSGSLGFGGPGGGGDIGGAAGAGFGGSGGPGGRAEGGLVTSASAVNNDLIQTSGDNAAGININASGGSGFGGFAGAGAAGFGGFGGNGGIGGAGGTDAFSTGGAGGIGAPGGIGAAGFGGFGRNGGDGIGGAVTVSGVNTGTIRTSGFGSSGILVNAQGGAGFGGFGADGGTGFGGFGGAGGDGGDAGLNAFGTSGAGGIGNAGGIGIGGFGGFGGSGGGGFGGSVRVDIDNSGTILTFGDSSHGIEIHGNSGTGFGGFGGAGADAFGGFGGSGGTGGGGADAAFGIGGAGGLAGDGGRGEAGFGGFGGTGGPGVGGAILDITVDNSGDISTVGAASHGIFVTSTTGSGFGGFGGDGGDAFGGNGGDGGDGGAGGDIVFGIFGGAGGAGGNGGNGGAAFGGFGGDGGSGAGGTTGDVIVTNSGSIITAGAGSHGIFVQTTATGAGFDGSNGAGGTATGGAGGTPGAAGIPGVGAGAGGGGTGGTGGTGGSATSGTGGIGGTGSAGVASGDVFITQTATGVIDTAGDAIHVEAVGQIEVTNSGDVLGGTNGIFAQSDADIDIFNLAGGLIDTDTGFAIDTVGAATRILSAGTIIGGMDLTDNDDVTEIQAGGIWDARSSTSDFRLGADSVTNAGSILAGGGTTFNNLETFVNFSGGSLVLTGGLFSVPNATTFSNEGTIFAETAPATIDTPVALANSGLIDMLDGVTNDVLTIDTDFVGSGASTLAIDASSIDADLLVITGNASGSTDVDVNFLGGFNPNGVLVVDTGTSTVDAFVLDDVFASPLVDLSLVRIGEDFFLISAPNAEGFAPLSVTTLALSLWYQSADEVIANLRIPAAYEGIGFWGQVYGSTGKMGEDDRQIIDDQPFDADDKLDTDRYGFEGGVDYGFGMARVGLTGGYGWANANSDIGFELDAKGWNIGLYGEYGGLLGIHAEAFVKTDKYNVDFDGGAFDNLSPDVRSTGIDAAVGYRFPIGGNIVLDPAVGVSHVWTKIDDIEAFGFTYDYDKLTSTRGRAGIRANFPGKWIPYLDGTIYREFDGDGDVALFDTANTFNLDSNGKGTWVRVEAGLGGWPSHGPMFAVWGEAGDRRGVGIRGGFRFGGPRQVQEAPPPAPVMAAPPPPPPAATQTCPDGTVILATDACPAPPPPAPPPPEPERG